MSIIQPTGYIQEQTAPIYLGFTTGSVIYLDANKKTSYPGSGSTWYDLSGNNRNGNITTGSINFISGGTGSVSYFSYPGGLDSSSSIVVNSQIGNSAQTGSITFGGWCKSYVDNYSTGSNGGGYIPLYSYGVATPGLSTVGLTSNVRTTGSLSAASLWGKWYGVGGVSIPVSTEGYFYNYNSKWVHIMAQWYYSTITPAGNGNIRLFVNGTLQAIDGESGAIGGDRICRVGCNSNFGYNTNNTFYNGSFATLEVYDKILSQNQIYGNFYVSKSLYGY